MEKFAGDTNAVKEFVEGFAKAASFLSASRGSGTNTKSMGDEVVLGMGEAIGKGMGSLGLALGATAIGTLYGAAKDMNLHNLFLKALERAVNSNTILKEASKERVIQYAETIFKFAPNVATDANLLSSILANAVHGEGIDPMTIKTLTELESKYKDNRSFSPKTYV